MGGQACRAKLREYVHTIYITHFHALSGPVNGQLHSTVDNHKTACRMMVVVIYYYNVPLSIRSVHYLLLSYQQWKCSKFHYTGGGCIHQIWPHIPNQPLMCTCQSVEYYICCSYIHYAFTQHLSYHIHTYIQYIHIYNV